VGRLHADKWSQLCRPCTDPAQTLLILQTLRGVRAADVIADTYTVCYTLSRKAFNELLGPIEDMWRFEALRKVRRSAAGACWRMQLCHWGVQTRWSECVLACSRHGVRACRERHPAMHPPLHVHSLRTTCQQRPRMRGSPSSVLCLTSADLGRHGATDHGRAHTPARAAAGAGAVRAAGAAAVRAGAMHA